MSADASLLGGYITMALSMLILAVVASALGQSASTAQNVCVAFLCIWAFVFGATSGPVAWVSSAEMHSLRLRTIGQAYGVIQYEIFSFGAAFWAPYMLNVGYGNMGTKCWLFLLRRHCRDTYPDVALRSRDGQIELGAD